MENQDIQTGTDIEQVTEELPEYALMIDIPDQD